MKKIIPCFFFIFFLPTLNAQLAQSCGNLIKSLDTVSKKLGLLSQKLEDVADTFLTSEEQDLIKNIEGKIQGGKLHLNNQNVQVKTLQKALKLVFQGEKGKTITDLNLSRNKLKMLKGLHHLKNLSNLNLSKNELTSVEGLENLSTLTILDLSMNNFEKKPNLPPKLEKDAKDILKDTPYVNTLPETIQEKIETIIEETLADYSKRKIKKSPQNKAIEKELRNYPNKPIEKLNEINRKKRAYVKKLKRIGKKEMSDEEISYLTNFLGQLHLLRKELSTIIKREEEILISPMNETNILQKLNRLYTNPTWLELVENTKNRDWPDEPKLYNTTDEKKPNFDPSKDTLKKQLGTPIGLIDFRIAKINPLLEKELTKIEQERKDAKKELIDYLNNKNYTKIKQLEEEFENFKKNYKPTKLDLTNKLTLFVYDSPLVREIRGVSYLIRMEKALPVHLIPDALTKALEKNLKNYPSIQKITLSNNFLHKFTIPTNARNLTKLDLSENKLTEITGLKHLTNIVTLNFAYNKLTSLEGLTGLNTLKNLNITFNNFSKESIPQLPKNVTDNATVENIFRGNPAFPVEILEEEVKYRGKFELGPEEDDPFLNDPME